MLDLLSLNDDVILLILRHISGRDALNISLTSKRAHSLASPRIASDLECKSPTELRKLHQYLLEPCPRGIARVLYLEKFTVHTSVFQHERSDPDGDEDEEHDEDEDEVYHFGADFSQAHLLGDILSQADHITQLCIDRYHPCLLKDPRIGSALCAMTRLSHCRLGTVADGTLLAMQAMHAPSLTRLTLSYQDEDDFYLKNERMSLPPLLTALSVFPSLHIVKLWNFTPSEGLSQDPPMPYPQLPSIHYLRLSLCSVAARDMVQFCPNLTTLVFALHYVESRPLPNPTAARSRRWPPLQRVMLCGGADPVCVAEYIGRVEQLQLSETFDISHPQYTDETLDLVSTTSPVGLYLSVRTNTQDAGSQEFWAALAKQAPRLRSLEIRIEVSTAAGQPQRDEAYGWVAKLPEALAPLSQLLCLRVFVPMVDFGFRLFPPSQGEQRLTLARMSDRRRISAQEDIPERLASSLSSLRYVGVGDAAENEQVTDAYPFNRVPGSVVWDELRRVSCIRKNRWWCIKHLGDRRELEEIPEEVGEEAQYIIETSGQKEESSLNEALARLSL